MHRYYHYLSFSFQVYILSRSNKYTLITVNKTVTYVKQVYYILGFLFIGSLPPIVATAACAPKSSAVTLSTRLLLLLNVLTVGLPLTGPAALVAATGVGLGEGSTPAGSGNSCGGQGSGIVLK